jgi:2-methylcitrate dehydratase PrpD
MNRRNVLRGSAVGLAGLSIPQARIAAQPAGKDAAMGTLSAYMSAAGGRALPPEVVEHTKNHIVDTLAAMLSGSELLPGQAALRYARNRAAAGVATIAGSTLTSEPLDAALVNGIMAHADETDDSHELSRSHPGCSVVPAALAMGEETGIDGARFLRAVALGYDIGTRVAMALGGVTFSYQSQHSTHSIAGVFGSAAAAACAAGLDARQMRWVLDYTAQQAAGIIAWRRDTDHIEKAFVFAGMPARNGVASALLVRSGWTGVDDIFSGKENFLAAYASGGEPAQLTDKLGERYEVARTDIKKWSVGSPIQAPLDALVLIRGKRPFDAEQIARVVVRLAPDVASVVDNRDIPDICLQHMVAVMLLDKTVSFKAAHDAARMKDPAALRQRAKVQLVADEALARLLPVRVAVVEVTLTDGTLLSERVEAVRGTVRNPMSKAEVGEKAKDLIAPVTGLEKAARLIAAVFNLEDMTSIRALRPLLQRE